LDILSKESAISLNMRTVLIYSLVQKFMLGKDVSAVPAKVKEMNNEIVKLAGEFEKTITTDEGRKLSESTKQSLAQYAVAGDKLLAAVIAGDREATALAQTDCAVLGKQVTAGFDALIKLNSDLARQRSENNATTANRAIWLALIITVVGMGLAIGLGIILALSITRPINQVVAGLSDGAEQVSAASSQVASSSQLLAEGSSEQAASLEETSSSLEEMSSMTKQNADNANQARALMAEVGKYQSHTNEELGHLVEAISEVVKSI